MRIAIIAVIASCTATLVATATPAQCDANSYIAYLNNHGTRVMAFDDATKVSCLHACELFRSRITLEQAAQSPSASDLYGIIDAAQHQLRPDTLH